MKLRGFTLVEILVAAAIFSAFMTGVFAIFRSASSSYIAGNWKTHAQNKLRIMLEDVKADIEKANNVFEILEANQNQIATTPIYINNNCYNDGTASVSVNIRNAAAFVPIMFMSVTKPRVAASVFTPVEQRGAWYGASLWGKAGKLYYSKTGSPIRYTTYPQSLPAAVVSWGPAGVTAGGVFEPAAKSASVVLEDVESVGINRIEIKDNAGQEKYVLRIRVAMRRTKGGQTTNTTLNETIDAKIQELTIVNGF